MQIIEKKKYEMKWKHWKIKASAARWKAKALLLKSKQQQQL